MRSASKALALFLTMLLVVMVSAEDFFQADFMSTSDAAKRWGHKSFSADDFRAAKPDQRAPMAVDILQRHLFIGEERRKVREQLGNPDGYFFSDTIYAYKLDKYTEGMKEAWQIIFVPDNELKGIKDVKIQKRCCYTTPSWAK